MDGDGFVPHSRLIDLLLGEVWDFLTFFDFIRNRLTLLEYVDTLFVVEDVAGLLEDIKDTILHPLQLQLVEVALHNQFVFLVLEVRFLLLHTNL